MPVLALVPLLAPGGAEASQPALAQLVKIVSALAVVGVVGEFVLPRLLARVAGRRNMEAFAVLAGFAVMLAAWVTERAGLSPALGGFLMGVLLSRSSFRHQVAAEVAPYKSLLLGLFFISVGMSVDVGLFLASWARILLLVAVLVVLKGALLFVLCRLFGFGTGSALRTSLLMTQGGEFGFVLFGEAAASGVMDAQLHTTALLVISISMAGTPLLARLADRLAGTTRPQGGVPPDRLADHVLIAGYGRVGEEVSAMLEQAGVSCLAIDLDPSRSRQGKPSGAGWCSATPASGTSWRRPARVAPPLSSSRSTARKRRSWSSARRARSTLPSRLSPAPATWPNGISSSGSAPTRRCRRHWRSAPELGEAALSRIGALAAMRGQHARLGA